jgi:hypothetical protein
MREVPDELSTSTLMKLMFPRFRPTSRGSRATITGLVWLLLSTLNLQLSPCFAQGTAFTYQGRLAAGGNATSGLYDLTFTLFDVGSGGSPIAGPVTNAAVEVTNGLFTTVLALGTNFPGQDRFLEIGVRTNGGGAFTTLSPRQMLTPTPYAIAARNLTGTVPAAQLTSIGNTNGGFGNFFVGPAGSPTTSGSENTAIGNFALSFNASGSYNTACGYEALNQNTNGSYNTAFGEYAVFLNRSGSYNTANGSEALFSNTNGSYNTAYGYQALFSNKSGSNNIAIGRGAGTAISTGNNNIDIGNAGFGNESDTIRIGTSQTKAVMLGISGGNIVSSSGLVCVNPSGLLGTVASGGATLAGDLQLAGGADYHHLALSGGNAFGYLYGSFPAYADGIHMGYNYYADANGTGHVSNSGGGTSRISAGYGGISLWVGQVGAAPIFEMLRANVGVVTVYGTFNNVSDRNAKQNFAPVSPLQMLDKVLQLPVSEWSYKLDSGTRHIGPVAQDFYSVFNIGTDDKHIAPIDEGGVALAAIQGLNQKVEAQGAELKQKQMEITELKESVAELKILLSKLTAERNGAVK